MVGTEQGEGSTCHPARERVRLQQEGEELLGEDRGLLQGALRPSLRATEEPLLPQGVLTYPLHHRPPPELPDCG